jgi:hypothetical protein
VTTNGFLHIMNRIANYRQHVALFAELTEQHNNGDLPLHRYDEAATDLAYEARELLDDLLDVLGITALLRDEPIGGQS